MRRSLVSRVATYAAESSSTLGRTVGARPCLEPQTGPRVKRTSATVDCMAGSSSQEGCRPNARSLVDGLPCYKAAGTTMEGDGVPPRTSQEQPLLSPPSCAANAWSRSTAVKSLFYRLPSNQLLQQRLCLGQ